MQVKELTFPNIEYIDDGLVRFIEDSVGVH